MELYIIACAEGHVAFGPYKRPEVQKMLAAINKLDKKSGCKYGIIPFMMTEGVRMDAGSDTGTALAMGENRLGTPTDRTRGYL